MSKPESPAEPPEAESTGILPSGSALGTPQFLSSMIEETVVQKHTISRSVVLIDAPDRTIPIERMSDPDLARTLLNERDYFRDQCEEKEQAIEALQSQMHGLQGTIAALRERLIGLDRDYRHALTSYWLEAALLAFGALLAGPMMAGTVSSSGFVGAILMAIGIASAVVRVKKHSGGQ